VPGKLRRFLSHLGPGLISGAANDDPSCISTYSIAGASLGYATLWASPLGLPLIAAVQLMCSRLAIVSGRGLAGAVRQHMPRWVLISTCSGLFAANAVNLGADLGGMAEATEMLTGVPWWVWTPVYGGALLGMLLWSSYQRIVFIFKWLALVLFAYVGAGVLARPEWAEVLRATLIPRFEFSAAFLSALVAIFGATLSPYLFFWQAAQEVEEEYARGRHTVDEREGASDEELRRSRIDVFSGAFVSRLIAYFVTISTAATLHAAGNRNISSARDAAAALEPIAGEAASVLFALGLIGTGMLAVPVLAGSSALIVIAMLVGVGLKLAGFSAVAMLFWSAAINGVLAPPLILIVVLLTGRREVMGDRTAPPLARRLGYAAFGITGAAAVAMLVSFAM
jgi:NRAMP (natural resistance-associated macrophage protein)-like metal ion transporter